MHLICSAKLYPDRPIEAEFHNLSAKNHRACVCVIDTSKSVSELRLDFATSLDTSCLFAIQSTGWKFWSLPSCSRAVLADSA